MFQAWRCLIVSQTGINFVVAKKGTLRNKQVNHDHFETNALKPNSIIYELLHERNDVPI